MSNFVPQHPRLCAYERCGREIKTGTVMFNGKFYHANENPKGEYVRREETCWGLSEQGKKSL